MKKLEDVCNTWTYPGGEVGVRAMLEWDSSLLARIQSSDDFMRLAMYLDALFHKGLVAPSLFIPYLPYARQDRVAVPGDPMAILVLARLLYAARAQRVKVLDAHSPAAIEAFRGTGLELVSLSPLPYLVSYLRTANIDLARTWLVAPDEGAAKKVRAYADQLELPMIQCAKVRDSTSGELSGFTVRGPRVLPQDSILVVVDDICDGGRTFFGVHAVLAVHFRWHHEVHLFTSHGIYSRGLEDLLRDFRTIGSTDSFLHGRSHERLITIQL